jgi:hypothetical protein
MHQNMFVLEEKNCGLMYFDGCEAKKTNSNGKEAQREREREITNTNVPQQSWRINGRKLRIQNKSLRYDRAALKLPCARTSALQQIT